MAICAPTTDITPDGEVHASNFGKSLNLNGYEQSQFRMYDHNIETHINIQFYVSALYFRIFL